MKNWKIITGILMCLLLIVVNIIAYNHAYRFTHFDIHTTGKSKKPEDLNVKEKVITLFAGVNISKPKNDEIHETDYQTVSIKSFMEEVLEAWHFKVDNARGTVVLFHGYIGKKSDLLKQSKLFNEYGYNTLLVDFYGSGSSTGSGTTVGYYEAENVKSAFDYVKRNEEKEIILYGPSMGAVSIIRAVAELGVNPEKIILECPYGSLLSTVKNRFKLLNVPSFGFAELLVFWGGYQNNFWGFELNAIEYAQKIHVPALIMHGALDKRADLESVQKLFSNLKGNKRIKIFENAGHESYVNRFEDEWKTEIENFLHIHNDQVEL